SVNGQPAQPLLLGDYLKSALTGQNLPTDLAADLRAAPTLRQYNAAASDGLQRPWELPDSDLSGAFRPSGSPSPSLLAPTGFPPGDGGPLASDDPDAQINPQGDDYLIGVQQPGPSERGATAAATNQQQYGDFVLVVDARLLQAGSAGYAFHLRRRAD